MNVAHRCVRQSVKLTETEQEISIGDTQRAAAQIHWNDDRIHSLTSNASSLSNAHHFSCKLMWRTTYKMCHHRLLWDLVPCLHRWGSSSWRSWYTATNCTIRATFMWRSGLRCDWSFRASGSTFLWQIIRILILQTDQVQNMQHHENEKSSYVAVVYWFTYNITIYALLWTNDRSMANYIVNHKKWVFISF